MISGLSAAVLILALRHSGQTWLRSDIGRLFVNFFGEAQRITLHMSERSEFVQCSGASLEN